MTWLDALFASLATWRMIRGGHWERWWVDSPVNAYAWHRVGECTYGLDPNPDSHRPTVEVRARPTALCRGRALCEHHH